MSWFSGDGGAGAFGGFGDFLGDLGGFVQDAGNIAESIGGILNPDPSDGPNPGIIPIPIGVGNATTGSPSSDSSGLILLAALAIGAYLLLRKG